MNEYTLPQVEEKLKELSPDFTVVPNPNSDLAGIYWQGSFAEISMSKDKVYELKNEGHIDDFGRPHAGLDSVMAKAKAFLERIETDEEFRIDITTPFDINKIIITDVEPIEPTEMKIEE